MGIEIEVKFRATPEVIAVLRQDFPGQEQVIQMQTTYYDTPDGALSARHYTLRRRLENDLSICTLKAPTSGFGRGEYELECDCIESAIPELCKLSGLEELPTLVQAGLTPVCGAAFTRIAKPLTLPGCTAELALDQGILSGGDKEIPLCEVELELKSGDQKTLLAFAKSLAGKYNLQLEQKSKFRRALALAKGE